jgi:serine/threonine-protein kinase
MGMTKTSSVMGSPLYMPPEQMRSAREADTRSDIWAMGAILYELIAARTPFAAETFAELVLKVAGSPPDSLLAHRPDVPPGLEQTILRCLEKDPARRFQNIGELAVALLEYGPKRARSSVERISRVIEASGLSTSGVALPPSSAMPEAGAGTVGSWGKTGPEATLPMRSRAGVFAAMFAFAVVAVVLAVIGWRALRAPTEGSVSSAEVSAAALVAPAPLESSTRATPRAPSTGAAAPTVSPAPTPAPSDNTTTPKASKAPGTSSTAQAARRVPSTPSTATASPTATATGRKRSDLGGRL